MIAELRADLYRQMWLMGASIVTLNVTLTVRSGQAFAIMEGDRAGPPTREARLPTPAPSDARASASRLLPKANRPAKVSGSLPCYFC